MRVEQALWALPDRQRQALTLFHFEGLSQVEVGKMLGISDEAVDAYGMAYDSPQLTAPELCRYHACVPCPAGHPLPLPLFHGVIPEGRYAVFSYSGPTGEVERAYRTIYSLWFPSTKLAPDDYVAFEHYLNDAPIEGHITYDIYIKVRPRT